MGEEVKSAILQCQIIDPALPNGAEGHVLARLEMPMVATDVGLKDTITLIQRIVSGQQYTHQMVNEIHTCLADKTNHGELKEGEEKPEHSNTRERRRPYKLKHIPSLAEIKQGRNWPVYEKILTAHDEGLAFNVSRKFIAGMYDAVGGAPSELMASDQDFVKTVFGCFLILHADASSLYVDEIAELNRFIGIAESLHAEVSVYAEKRHALVESLKAAHAGWRTIAAIVTEGWDDMEQWERDNTAIALEKAHRKYMQENGEAVRKIVQEREMRMPP